MPGPRLLLVSLLPLAARAVPVDFPRLAPYAGLDGGASVRLREWDLGDKRNQPSDAAEASLGLRLGLQLVWRFAAEIEVAALPEVTREDGDKGTVTSYAFQLLHHFRGGTWSPVAAAGAGAYHSISQDAGRELDPRGHVGFGLRAMAAEWAALRLDVRDVFADGPDQAGAHNVEVIAGVDFFRFEHRWPPGDRDRDGIADEHDACPDITGMESAGGCFDGDRDGIVHDKDPCPDEPGPAATGGCPDADGDALADRDDACPKVAGLAALKGCPDADGDGLRDADDRCPQAAGAAALGGCPDRDGDGIADGDDRCPDVPGPADHGGCVPEAVHKITGPITAIRFKRDSAVLLQASSAALDEVVKALKEFGGVRLRIEGHADESLDAERNRTVSQARAEAVRDYLVGKGVDAGRLEAVGYGDTRPREGTQGRKSRAIELVPIGAGKP